jgi:hypothetical protein
MTECDRLFARYLRKHGYAGWGRHEPPELHTGTSSPDFLIHRGNVSVICEVKEFTTRYKHRAATEARGKTIKWSNRRVYGTVRNSIREAASQMKPLADDARPLVVVLGNLRNADVRLEPTEVIYAMYGDPTFVFTNPSLGAGESRLVPGRNGQLTNQHRYISAIVCLRCSRDQTWEQQAQRWVANLLGADRTDMAAALDRNYVALDVIDTLSAVNGEAVQVPIDMFDGPDDRRWTPHGDNYVRVRRGN